MRFLLFLILACGLLDGPARAQPLEEVPFVTTPDNVTLTMLRLAGVGQGDRLIDLGSGDGRIVITAARRHGARGLGVEIVPDLVALSEKNAQRAGVTALATFRVQDLFQTDLSAATVITMYLLPEVNLQLRPTLLALKPGTRLVSHDWDMGDWAPDQTEVVEVPDKKVGLEKRSRVHRWVVPARVEGLWCAGTAARLTLTQKYQVVEATLQRGPKFWRLHGRLDGPLLHLTGDGGLSLTARADEAQLRVSQHRGTPLAPSAGGWRRASGTTCEG